MARLSLQVKNVATLFFSLGTSVFTGVAAKRLFDSPPKPWGWLAATGFMFLLCQVILLLFIESKEEEELSLLRTARLDRTRALSEERRKLGARIQLEIDTGSPDTIREWHALREKLYGE